MFARQIKKERAQGKRPRPEAEITNTGSYLKNTRFQTTPQPPIPPNAGMQHYRTQANGESLQDHMAAYKAAKAYTQKLQKMKQHVVHEETVKKMARSKLANPGRVKGKTALSNRQKKDTRDHRVRANISGGMQVIGHDRFHEHGKALGGPWADPDMF